MLDDIVYKKLGLVEMFDENDSGRIGSAVGLEK
jgi:hypothetical protein